MRLSPKIAGLIFAIVAFAALGFFREWVFKSINLRLALIYYDIDGPILSGILTPLNQLSYTSLYYSKFFLTLFFILLYYLLTLLLIHFLYHYKRYNLITTLLFGGLTLLSFLGYLLGWLSGETDLGYSYSRIIAGMVQSPLPAMLLIPAFILINKKTFKDKP